VKSNVLAHANFLIVGARANGKDSDSMRNWTTKEARCVLNWARQSSEERIPLEDLAHELGRSIEAVRGFLRRVLPPGQRPWTEKPRWTLCEVEAVMQEGPTAPRRSAAAVKKYVQRHCTTTCGSTDEAERASLTVAQIASDLGISRAAVYRLVNRGILRRFKGRIAHETMALKRAAVFTRESRNKTSEMNR
jgi:hypothetical protein